MARLRTEPSIHTAQGGTATSSPQPVTVENEVLDCLELLDESDDEDAASPSNDYFAALEPDRHDAEELHYLGSGVFSHSVLELTSLDVAGLGPLCRQVSSPQHPVFFMRSPSRVYGSDNAAAEARETYEIVTEMLRRVEPELPQKLIKHFTDHVLPAYPIFNAIRLEGACQAWQGGGPFPHVLLVGIMAFSAVSVPAARHKCKELWGYVVRLLESEYRQPRLQTLQLALLDIGGRPVLNPGGNHMAIARAIGAAQLLGLHRDCSRWRLPRWERSVRKRLWWALYVQDKWNAFLFGRPSNIHADQADILLPTLRDDDWGGDNPQSPGISAFIVDCRIAIVLSALLPVISEPHTQLSSAPRTKATLQRAAHELSLVNLGLSDMVSAKPRPGANNVALQKLGIEVLICRLAIESAVDVGRTRWLASMSKAMNVVESMTSFISKLTQEDFQGYWSALGSSYLLTGSFSTLLRLATRLYQDHPDEIGTSNRILQGALELARAIERIETAWEVAEAAMPRVRSLINSLPSMPGSEQIKEIGAPGPLPIDDSLPLDILSWLE